MSLLKYYRALAVSTNCQRQFLCLDVNARPCRLFGDVSLKNSAYTSIGTNPLNTKRIQDIVIFAGIPLKIINYR